MIEIFGHFLPSLSSLMTESFEFYTWNRYIRPFLQKESQFSGELAVNYLVTRYHTHCSYLSMLP
ncbi:hypothetical protein WN943_005816 [Citrus x changshan-huyou]